MNHDDGLYPTEAAENMFKVNIQEQNGRHLVPTRAEPMIPVWNQVCPDPNHLPGILMISLQPGQVYEHVCPSCGHVTRIAQQNPIYCNVRIV